MSSSTSTQATATSRAAELIRGLGPWSAVSIVIGDTIGTGVFLVSSDMARVLGSPGRVLVAWLVGGIIVFFGACCYSELGASFPHAGGSYVYLGRGLGPLWGFLFGWMSSFLDRPVAMATLAAGFLRLVSFLVPAVSTPLFSAGVAGYTFTFTLAQPLAALVVITVTTVNVLKVRTGGSIQVVATFAKIGTIVVIVVAAVLLGKSHPTVNPAPAMHTGFGAVTALLTALVPAMWAYNGFNDLGDVGEEIERPGRNIPFAMLLGLGVTAALYLLVNAVYFRVLPLRQIAESQHLASDVVQSLAGSQGAAWLTGAMALSALGALHVTVLTGSRIPFAMAREGLFFSFAGRIHPRLHTPTGALLFLGAVGALLALTGTYEELYSLFVFAVWIFFALNALALLRLRKLHPQLERPYRAFGYPWTTVIFLIAAAALTCNLWWERPLRSSLGLVIILAGIPFYRGWRSK